MFTFIVCIICLILGYVIYGKVVEHFFNPSNKPTPAISCQDGVDYVPMSNWKVFLIQLLNIAGTGPIFGALMGAVFGPVVFLWIVAGSIFAGAVHDYMTGMISIRKNGATITEIVGEYLGIEMKQVMRLFTIILLVLVGTVFVTSPATLLALLTPESLNVTFWICVILIYYVLATLLPIDKIIGRIYPVFGIILLFMVVAIPIGIFYGGYTIPELTLENLHPEHLSIWPFMFITVACGAISGFHATQTPLMSRCITNEKSGRKIFYGAMITEGLIALVWAAAGVAFYNSTGGLLNALNTLGQSGVVYEISVGILGLAGGILAIIGVVACPITSGDTAFRSARITLAEWFNIDQKPITKRLLLTIPLLVFGALLTQIDFNIIWRYFAWSNQVLASIVLWTIAVYLIKHVKGFAYIIAVIPATFLTAVTSTYILVASEGLYLSASIGYPIGIIFAIATLCLFIYKCIIPKSKTSTSK